MQAVPFWFLNLDFNNHEKYLKQGNREHMVTIAASKALDCPVTLAEPHLFFRDLCLKKRHFLWKALRIAGGFLKVYPSSSTPSVHAGIGLFFSHRNPKQKSPEKKGLPCPGWKLRSIKTKPRLYVPPHSQATWETSHGPFWLGDETLRLLSSMAPSTWPSFAVMILIPTRTVNDIFNPWADWKHNSLWLPVFKAAVRILETKDSIRML